MLGVLPLAFLLLAAVPQVHPCDSAPAGPWIWRGGSAPTFGWCQDGMVTGFIVSLDSMITDIRLPVRAATGTGILGAYYTWKSPFGVSKGTHTFRVRAYSTGGMGPATSLQFTRP